MRINPFKPAPQPIRLMSEPVNIGGKIFRIYGPYKSRHILPYYYKTIINGKSIPHRGNTPEDAKRGAIRYLKPLANL